MGKAMPFLSANKWLGTVTGQGLPNNPENHGLIDDRTHSGLGFAFDMVVAPRAAKTVGIVGK